MVRGGSGAAVVRGGGAAAPVSSGEWKKMGEKVNEGMKI